MIHFWNVLGSVLGIVIHKIMQMRIVGNVFTGAKWNVNGFPLSMDRNLFEGDCWRAQG